MRALNCRITRAGLSFRRSAFKSRDGMKHKAKTQKKRIQGYKSAPEHATKRENTDNGVNTQRGHRFAGVGGFSLWGTEGLHGPVSHQGHVRPPSVFVRG